MVNNIGAPSLLVLIRHGKSLRNQLKDGNIYFTDEEVRRKVRGMPDHDIPLTDEGHQQAKAVGNELKKRFGIPNFLYHSGYKRTADTADHILDAYSREERKSIKMRTEIMVRERDPGYCYDMMEHEARSTFPWLKEHWKTFGPFMARPPGGESLADMIPRVSAFLGMLNRNHYAQKVFVISHCGTIRCFRFILEDQNISEINEKIVNEPIDNCSMTVYEYDLWKGSLLLQDAV